MSESSHHKTARAQRIRDAVMEVEGVVDVKVWELPGGVEIGIHIAPGSPCPDVLKRVHECTDTLRDPSETWDVGLLTEPS